MTMQMKEAAFPPVFTGQLFKKTEPRATALRPTSVNDRYVPLDYFEQSLLRIQAERVESFSTLPEGWNHGRGIPSTAIAVSEAIRFLSEGLAQSRVVAATAPLESGGVLLEWTFGELELHVEIDASGTADYFISRGDEILEENSLRFVGPHIRQLREALAPAVHQRLRLPNIGDEIANDEPLWRCVHASHLKVVNGEIRPQSIAFRDMDRFSVYLARYANLSAILAHFEGSSVAEIVAGDLSAHGFTIICSPSEQIDEPHADVFPPKGVGKNKLLKIIQNHVIPASRWVHTDQASFAMAKRVPDAVEDL